MSALTSLKQHDALIHNPDALETLAQAESLADALQRFNNAYRQGAPLVSDELYDTLLVPALREESPDHPFLTQVEPEPVMPGDMPRVKHASQMLSTDKAYSQEEVESYLNRVARVAASLGMPPGDVSFRLTPKLDGIAGADDGERLVTRGDGLQGRDITRVLDEGAVVKGGRGFGRGELVCDKAFFEQHLGPGTTFNMDHARNFVAGFAGADSIKDHHRLALDAGAIHFVPFSTLPDHSVTADELRDNWRDLYTAVLDGCAYDTDGVVVAVSPRRLHEAMGATNHHERGVLAIKRRSDIEESTVLDIRLTTGRTGRIIPTLIIEPVTLSGALVSRVTAHTARNLHALGLGAGAKGIFTRSGEVIPYLCEVTQKAPTPTVVTHCPSCGTKAELDGEHMICPNTLDCQAQAEARLRHWFQTLGNVDLFGPRTITTLADAGITSIEAIYAMTADDFADLGFGPGQSSNLVRERERSTTEPVADWRFLAAFGIRHLGKGDARRLLAEVPLEEVTTLNAADIEAIDGFGAKTSPLIAHALNAGQAHIAHMLGLGFTLERTPLASSVDATPATGLLAGEKVVFTGTMQHGKRKDMEAEAADMGADVQSAVNGQTTLLVIGEKAGSKLKKAEAINAKAGREVVIIMPEEDYRSRIA